MSRYPEIANLCAAETWIYVREIICLALSLNDNRQDLEECEDLVGSLGPEYETDPDLLDALLAGIDPQQGVDALLAENPGFDLNDPMREVVCLVVSAVMNLRATAHDLVKFQVQDDEEKRRLKEWAAEMNRESPP